MLTCSSDFIRHGKHARAHQATDAAISPPQAAAPLAADASRKEAEARRQERAEREKEDKAQPVKDKQHRTQAAEAIVKEERAASSKMPTIKGLESYALLDKMGESVRSSQRSSLPPLTPDGPFSGAFSNVYKALDKRSGQKVASKQSRCSWP